MNESRSSIDHSFFPNTNFDKLSLGGYFIAKKNDAIERERFRSTSSSFLSSEKMILFSSFSMETEDDDDDVSTRGVQGWGKPYQQKEKHPSPGALSKFFFINSTRTTLRYASLRCYVLLHTLVCLNCAFAEANCVVVDETANMVSIINRVCVYEDSLQKSQRDFFFSFSFDFRKEARFAPCLGFNKI